MFTVFTTSALCIYFVRSAYFTDFIIHNKENSYGESKPEPTFIQRGSTI